MKDFDNNQPRKSKGVCSNLTRTELILGVLVALLVMYFLYVQMIPNEIVQLPECVDTACYESIIEINDFVDPSIDPCEDFHQYVCGNFLENAYKWQTSNVTSKDQEELHNELDAMISEPITSKDSQAIILQKTFFQACTDEEQINLYSEKKVLDLIDQIGGWPYMKGQNWNENDFDWTTVMVQCKNLGLPYMWFLEFGIHYVDGINYFKVGYPKLQQKHDKKVIERVIGNLLMKKVYGNEISDFDRRLANIINDQKSEITLHTIDELQVVYPPIDWLEILNAITGNSYKLTEDTQIASNVKDYVVQLYQLLKGTPKRTQANYIAWKIVEYFVPFMSNQLRQHVINGTQDRAEACKELTRISFPYFSEVEYVRKYATEDVKTSAAELTLAIRDEFIKRIQESTWWNSTAAQIYLQTFEATEIDIGLDVGTVDEDFLEANYLHIGNLTFETKTPHIIDIITERSKQLYNVLFTSINRTGVDPEEKNLLADVGSGMFFHVSLNKMVITPAMLHGFLYDDRRNQYLNFASLGTLLAREFITTLQIFTESDKNVTNAAFEASDRCFEDDYLQIISETSTFDSLDVVQEILPDILARDISYAAYQNWVTINGEEVQLPVLSYTPNQLFWIKSSLINCNKKLMAETQFELMVSRFRNTLSARHSRYFGNDFDCPENAMMNPLKKC